MCEQCAELQARVERLRAALRYAWQTEGGVRKEDDALYAELTHETIPQHSSMDYGGGAFDKDGNEGPNEAPVEHAP